MLSLFIHDDRYQAPSLILLVGETEESARELAAADLRDNPHHTAIEVRVDDTLVFELRRETRPGGASADGWDTP